MMIKDLFVCSQELEKRSGYATIWILEPKNYYKFIAMNLMKNLKHDWMLVQVSLKNSLLG